MTGEVIGQVASQTLENLTNIAEATTLEVLRPLVGMDKDEITAEAERIGTLPISIIPDQDCCQLFTPRHPATRVKRPQVLAAEATLPIDEMIARAVAAAAVEEFRVDRARSGAGDRGRSSGPPGGQRRRLCQILAKRARRRFPMLEYPTSKTRS